MLVVSLSQIYSCVLCIPPLFRILYSVFMLVAAFKLLQRRCTFDCTLKPGLWENPQLRNSMIERRGRCRWRWGMILERRKEIRMSQWLVGWWEWYECLLRSILALCTVGPTIPSLGHHLSTGRHKNQTRVVLIFFAACKYFVFFGHFYALLPFFCLTFLLTLLLLLQQTMLGVGLPADQTGLVHARLHFSYALTRNPSVSKATQIH